MASRLTNRSVMTGAGGPGTMGSIDVAGGTVGGPRSANVGPGRLRENAPSARASSFPSCSMRADTVVSEPPARSIDVAIRTAPSAGGAM